MDRIFIVGCPRSGTTLLQSLLASHSEAISFPETHFFSETLHINSILRRLKLYGKKDRDFVRAFLFKYNYELEPFKKFTKSKMFTHRQWCNRLIAIIDEMAEQKSSQGTSFWIEKTPRHLHYISSISNTKFQAKFLHILRNGVEVVASLHLATQKYPDKWGGKRSIDKCISWWNNSIKASLKYKDSPNHLFITYDYLINNTQNAMQGICKFIGVDYEPAMLNEFHKTAQDVTNEDEKWKSRNTNSTLNKSNKLRENFSPETIEYINHNVINVESVPFGAY